MARRFLTALLALIVLGWAGHAAAHTPDWLGRLLEWVSSRKVGEAPSAGWLAPKPASDFQLVDQSGQPVTLHDLRGKVVLLNFAYTGCGDACVSVKELKNLARVLGGKMGTAVFFVSITLDPARDTPEALQAFARQRAIGAGWKLATGSWEIIERLAQAYGVYVRRGDGGRRDSPGSIEYSDTVMFLDRAGRLRKRVLPHVLRLSGRADVEWLLEGHDHD